MSSDGPGRALKVRSRVCVGAGVGRRLSAERPPYQETASGSSEESSVDAIPAASAPRAAGDERPRAPEGDSERSAAIVGHDDGQNADADRAATRVAHVALLAPRGPEEGSREAARGGGAQGEAAHGAAPEGAGEFQHRQEEHKEAQEQPQEQSEGQQLKERTEGTLQQEKERRKQAVQHQEEHKEEVEYKTEASQQQEEHKVAVSQQLQDQQERPRLAASSLRVAERVDHERVGPKSAGWVGRKCGLPQRPGPRSVFTVSRIGRRSSICCCFRNGAGVCGPGGGSRRAQIWTSIGVAKSMFDELRAQAEPSRIFFGGPLSLSTSRACTQLVCMCL